MIEEIDNGETGLSVRTKLNEALTLLNAGCVFGGTADPVADPGTDYALYIQTPQGAEWLWFDSAWHFKG